MGLSKCFIAARSVGGLVSDLKETATQGEWSIFEPTSGWVRPRELEELCIRAASNVEDIALAVLIEDSDIAYLAAGTPEGIVARLLYGTSPDDYADGVEALELIGYDHTGNYAQFEVWSQLTGSPVTQNQLASILSEDWVLAEDAVAALLERLHIPFP